MQIMQSVGKLRSLSLVVPCTEERIEEIIRRDDRDWEFSFHYPGRAIAWWNATRSALAEIPHELLAIQGVRVEDLELQVGYLLHVHGQIASPLSCQHYRAWERASPPYCVFGSRMSVALICYLFYGAYGYHRVYQGHMAVRLKLPHTNGRLGSRSPLFNGEFSIHQLDLMIRKIGSALHNEDERVGWILPWQIRINDVGEVRAYYYKALKALDPTLGTARPEGTFVGFGRGNEIKMKEEVKGTGVQVYTYLRRPSICYVVDLMDEWGFPSTFLGDRGTILLGQPMRNLSQTLEVAHHHTYAY